MHFRFFMPVTHLFRVVTVREILHIFFIYIVTIFKFRLLVRFVFIWVTVNFNIIYLLIDIIKVAPIVSLFWRFLPFFESFHKILKLWFLLVRPFLTKVLNLLFYWLLREEPLEKIDCFISFDYLISRGSIRVIFSFISYSLRLLAVCYILSED